MKANKICSVGARKALTNFFVDEGAINPTNNRIRTWAKVYPAHKKLKDMLFNAYGINREIIDESSQADYLQFNNEVLDELDALSGVYTVSNQKYRRDFTNDRTLTPVDLVKKYVARANTPSGLEILRYKDWTLEEVNKFKAGMRAVYPDIMVQVIETGKVNGAMRYNLELVPVPENTAKPIIADEGANPNELREQREMEIVTAAIEPLTKVFKNATVNWVTQQELQDMLRKRKPKVVSTKGMNITGVAIGRDIYLVKGMVTPETAIEEFMHMFVDSLAVERKALYLGLLRQAKENYPVLAAQVAIDYADENGFTQEDRDSELLAKALQDAYVSERQNRPQGVSFKDFLKLAKEFFKWLTDKIATVLDLPIEALPLNATIGEVATYLNIDGLQLPYAETTDARFNIEPGEQMREEFEEEDLINEIAKSGAISVKDLKIERAEQQEERLYNIAQRLKKQKVKGTQQAIKTIEALVDLTRRYREEVLETDTKTVSVTKFTGTPIFNARNKKIAEASINFGVFLHDFMENLMLSALEAGVSVGEFIRENPNYFDDYYNTELEVKDENGNVIGVMPRHKKFLNYKGITQEQVKKDVMKMVDIVAADSVNAILIPEITVYGTDSLGRVVDGRLDYIIVRNDGTIVIKDFKTHKYNGYLKAYSDQPLNVRRQSSRLMDGVHPFFETIPNKTKFSSYLSQLTAYARILKQQGFNADPGSIISMIYYKDPNSIEEDDEFVYGGAHVADVPVVGNQGMMMNRDVDGNPTAELDPRYEKIVRIMTDALPVEGETGYDEPIQEEINRQNEYATLPMETVQTVLKNLSEKIKNQLDDIRKQISEAERSNADETKIQALKSRQELLRSANFMFATESERGKFREVPPEAILKSVMEKAVEVVNNLKKESIEIADAPEANAKDRAVKIQELSKRNAQLNDYINFLKSFTEILSANGFKSDNPIIAEMDQAVRVAREGQQKYIDIAKEQMITKMLLKVNRNLAERMMESMRSQFEFRKAKLESVVNGDNSFLSKTNFWLGGKINRVLNGAINTLTGTSENITNDMKEAAQEELKKIEFWEKNKQYDRNFVEMYVNNTFNDPSSGFYIGSTITPRGSSWTGDDFVASFGNSELAISAMASYGIYMNEEAKNRFFDTMEKLSIDQLYAQMTRKYGSYEAAVAAMSQEVSIKDLATGLIKDYRMFLTPEIMAYYAEYDRLDYAVRSLKDQIAQVKQDSTLEKAAQDKKIAELNAQLDVAQTEWLDWYLENSETKLLPEVYKLEVQFPAEIQDKIAQLNDRIRDLVNPANYESDDFQFNDSLVEEVQQLEADIAKLKREAIENNPELQDVFDKYDKYYDYYVNQSGWDYQKNWMIKRWGEDSPQFKAWLELNSDLVPVPSWYEKVGALKKEKSEIFGGGDPVLQELFKNKTELMNKYKFKSRYSVNRVFNPMMMSEEDYAELVAIEDAIEDRYDDPSRPVTKLSKIQRQRLDQINDELAELEMHENKSSYVKRFNDMRNRLTHLRDQVIRLRTDPTKSKELNEAMVNYANYEITFKNWYDRNNKSEYEMGTLDRGGSISMDPRRFNVVGVPQDKSLMVRVPSSKWRTRARKPEAYNPNYSPSLMKRRYGFGPYAMPKGIKYDNKTGRYDVDPKSKWANPRYVEMMKDKEAMDFYNKVVMDLYINKQTNLSAQRLGHFYPSVQQPGFESVAQDGFDGLKREWKEAVDSVKLYDSQIEKDINEFGILSNNRVRFPHNSLWTADLTTKDGLNAILKWNLSYEVNQSMEEANLVMSPTIDFLETKKSELSTTIKGNDLIIKQLDKVIDIMKFERNKFIYGQTMEVPEGGMRNNLANRKVLKMLMSVVSFGRLGFDPVMQTGNLISGNVQTFLAGEIRENGVGGTEDFLWAKAQIYNYGGFFWKVVENWGELSGVNLETKILRFFNPTMKDFDRLLDSTGRGQMRRLLMRGFNVKDIAFVIQDKGEMEIGMSTMLKNLHAHMYNVFETDSQGNVVLDENGNRKYKKDAQGQIVQVTAYDALVNGAGATPQIRADVDMTMEDLEGIRSITYNEYLKFQGNYSNYMKPAVESSIAGILMTFFRKYLVTGVENRFKGAFGIGDPKNWTSGRIQVGWWTAMMQIMKYGQRGAGVEAILPGFVSKALGMNKLNTFYASKAMQARREVVVALVLTMAFVTLRSLVYGDDDDKEEVNWASLQAMRMFGKVANESRSMVWIPVIGKTDDYITNFSTFTSAFNEGKMVGQLISNTFFYTTYGMFEWEYAQEMGFYQRRAGRFEKGDPKVLANLLKLSGIENILDIFEPIYAVKEMYKRKS